MGLIWWEFALIGVMFASILLLFAGGLFGFFRLRVQKWIGGAIGNFMINLSKKATEEEGSEGRSSSSGALSLGGFKITPELLQTGMQLLKMAQEMGFLKGGALGGGGGGSGL